MDCGKTLSKFLARPGNPTRIGVEYADAQPNWQLPYIWFDGDTVNVIGCLAVLAVLSMEIGFIGLAQCWGVFGWSILHLATQLFRYGLAKAAWSVLLTRI